MVTTQGAGMRSEREMLDLILSFAWEHDEVRAVVMNGSRVNPNAKRDPFQDYDVVYFVRSVEPFRRNATLSNLRRDHDPADTRGHERSTSVRRRALQLPDAIFGWK
jgi:hypothetical protein